MLLQDLDARDPFRYQRAAAPFPERGESCSCQAECYRPVSSSRITRRRCLDTQTSSLCSAKHDFVRHAFSCQADKLEVRVRPIHRIYETMPLIDNVPFPLEQHVRYFFPSQFDLLFLRMTR